MYDMILAAIWVLVVSTLLSLVLFTLGSSVHIRSGGGGLFPVCEGCGRPIRRPARRVLSGKRGPY